MNPVTYANLFELAITPLPDLLYRGLRPENDDARIEELIPQGRFIYSLFPHRLCPDTVSAAPQIIKDIIRNQLAASLAKSDQFFDISDLGLSGTITGNLLHKEEVFSIARSFQLQVMFSGEGMYLAVLAAMRVYNRLRLPEVRELLGDNWTTLPQKALCFAGKGNDAKWRDGQILSMSDESCLVRIPSIHPSEVTLPNNRIIPKLKLTTIKRLLLLKKSRTQIEQMLKTLRAGKEKNEGKAASENSLMLLKRFIAPLFPLLISEMRVNINQSPISMVDLQGTVITEPFKCMSKLDGKDHVFNSLRTGLQQISFKNAKEFPVAIFATPVTKDRVQSLIETLNDPKDGFAGFRGLPVHFGIRLRPVTDSPYVVRSVEEYMEVAQSLSLSPDAEKISALAFVALSEEDETYQHPVPLYYRLKARLARAGHPSQMADTYTLTNKYARWNLGLNIAAKLGAIPWTLEDKSVLEPVDLFLGFSYSSIRTEGLGQSRNIAYVNVFDSAGTWQVFHSDGSVFSFDDRLKVFPRIASQAVRSATDNPSALRLVEVHYNKRFGRKERQAIAQGIRAQAPKASIIFVSVADDHPIRFFDSTRAQNSSARGTSLQLGEGTYYIQTAEADDWSGLPRPLRLQVYRDFAGLDQGSGVSRRILALTRLNWRSVREHSSLPVTVLYSSLVARLTNYFSLTDWNDIDHSLKRTPWFL